MGKVKADRAMEVAARAYYALGVEDESTPWDELPPVSRRYFTSVVKKVLRAYKGAGGDLRRVR